MSKRTIGIGLIILGIVVVVISLAADALGIGNAAGIGWKQILGAVVGILVMVGGALVGWSKPDPKN